MKKMDLFCASPSSTAICSSSSSVDQGGGRAIDRHNPHLRDGRRSSRSSSSSNKNSHLSQTDEAPSQSQSHSKPSKNKLNHNNNKKSRSGARKSSSSTSSAAGSTRYLLSDTITYSDDLLTDYESMSSSLVSIQSSPGFHNALGPSSPPPLSSSTNCNDHQQVVVLRVSLHCRGCEGKVRKHLTKMKGVTSFNIDFAMKKVTVIGEVTPLSVLASISRVKNAQFWPSLSSNQLTN